MHVLCGDLFLPKIAKVKLVVIAAVFPARIRARRNVCPVPPLGHRVQQRGADGSGLRCFAPVFHTAPRLVEDTRNLAVPVSLAIVAISRTSFAVPVLYVDRILLRGSFNVRPSVSLPFLLRLPPSPRSLIGSGRRQAQSAARLRGW